jgi:hypothetical protein
MTLHGTSTTLDRGHSAVNGFGKVTSREACTDSGSPNLKNPQAEIMHDA